ncbi:MCE family protein [Bdellovibrio sp. qaytius]|nr:MCE family protein [Bdellovibrio sp. qaytius]
MSFFSTAEFKVGALVVSIGALIALMSMQVSDDPSFLGRSKKAWFYLDNANGLTKGSAIRSAGIPVGAIKDISLAEGKARIDVTVKSDVPLTRSAIVEMRANGILGDKYIEISPGSATDPGLEDGGQIANVKTGGSLDDVMTQVSDITTSLKDVAKNLNEATSAEGTNKHIMGRIVQNIEKLTGDLSQMTAENKEQISEIVDQVHDITSTMDGLINDESETGFKKTWKNSMVRIDKSLKNIEEITDKVNKGEGTIGKLISDEKTAEDVSSAIEGISGLVDTANKTTTAFDFNGYYLNDIGAKSSIGIQIQPGLDRYYYLALVDDPAGVVDKKNILTTTNGGTPNNVDETTTYKNKTKFTALFAKNVFDFTLKGGLIENAGGIGVDYSPFKMHRLKFSVEAFDFGDTNLRTTVSYKFRYGMYVLAGYNDMLHNTDAQSAYAGAGLFLTNDDLKLLLTKSPF